MAKKAHKSEPTVSLRDTLTADNIEHFLAGRISWAELVGVTPMAYASAALVARYLYHEGRLDEAKLILETLTWANPHEASVWVGLGAVHQRLGDLAEAHTAYDRAIAIMPDLAAARFNRAEIALVQGDAGAARADLQRVVERGGAEPEVVERAQAVLRQLDGTM